MNVFFSSRSFRSTCGLCLMAGLSAGSVSAATPNDLYVALGVGQANYDDGGQFDGLDLDSNDTARLFSLGWYLSKDSAVEFGYRYFGGFDYVKADTIINDEVTVSVSALTGVQEFRLAEKFSVVPRGGLAFVGHEQSLPSTSTGEFGLLLGAGARYDALPNLKLELLAESLWYRLHGSVVGSSGGQIQIREESITQNITHLSAQVLIVF